MLRLSIARLMMIVGVVAFNLAALQFWSPSSDPSLFTGRVLMSLALQFGLFRLIRSRQIGHRAFWRGFLSFGLAAFVTCVFIDFSSALPFDFSPIDSYLFRAMDEYLVFTYDLLTTLCNLIPDPYIRSRLTTALVFSSNDFICHLMFDLISFLPQLFIALSGGTVTSLAVRFWSKRHDSFGIGVVAA